jgi:hypothetical protein
LKVIKTELPPERHISAGQSFCSMNIPNTDISPEEAQASVDERIQRLVQELKTEQNPYARISRLPEELLIEVFMILKSISPFGGWHRVNLVCSHWRNVAVATPVLWTNPPTRNHDFTLLMLERSEMADLDIYMNEKTSMDTAAAVLRHIARIRGLNIVENNKIFKKAQDLLLGLDQPNLRLEKLRIVCYWDGQYPQFASFVDTRPLWNQLRYLSISGLIYDWNLFPLPELEHLLIGHSTELVVPISTQKLVETLSQMPKLDELAISLFNMVHRDNRAVDDGKFAELPSLSNLSVTCDAPHELDYFLFHLCLPRLSQLSIYCDNSEHENNADYSRTIEAITSLINKGNFGTGLESLSLCDDELILSFIDRHKYSESWPRVRIFLEKDEEPSQFITEVLFGLVKMTQSKLSFLVHAEINSFASSFTQQALQLLGSLPSLERISVHNGHIVLLTSALTIPPDLLPDSPSPFPKLKSIKLLHLTCSSNELLQFCKCLAMRRNCGTPVEEIELSDCCFQSQDEMALLRNVVGNIVW